MLIRRLRRSETAKFAFCLVSIVLIYVLYSDHNKDGDKRTFDKNKNKLRYKLTIIVLSGPNNVEERNAVRRTWMSDGHVGVRSFFAVGILNADSNQVDDLRTEDKRHGDLLLLPDLEDSYEALTSKVLQSFSLVHEKYDFDFLLKCDDDSLVLVDRVLKELDKWEREETRKELYWGFFNGRAQVKRNGPWKETDWIFCDFYLPYALGGGYVLSHRLVKFIAENSEILKRYNSEDVSVGLWLAPLSHIERKHDTRFDTEYRSRGCSNEYIITHKQSPKSMDELYQTYKASGALCLKEVIHRNSYEYNWTVPPSKCCDRQPGIP